MFGCGLEWTLCQGRNKGHMLCSKSHCRCLVMEWTTSCILPMFTATRIYFTDAPYYFFKCIIVVYCVLELCKHTNTAKLTLQFCYTFKHSQKQDLDLLVVFTTILDFSCMTYLVCKSWVTNFHVSWTHNRWMLYQLLLIFTTLNLSVPRIKWLKW